MSNVIGRRAVLVGGGALAAGLVLVGAGAALAAPNVGVYPLTPTLVAVVATGLAAGTASVTDSAGRVLATTRVSGGAAVLRVPAAAGSVRACRFRAPGYARTITVSTAPAAVAASPWRLVNKRIALPSTYVPPGLTGVEGQQLRREAAAAYLDLKAAARRAGHSMALASGYRSYATQVSTYRYWVSRLGQAEADRVSARAGHSEHQTGLALDVKRADGYCTLSTCFGRTALGRWLVTHARTYGFLIRYEAGQTPVTGYAYEPWHLRFVGGLVSMDYTRRGHHALETYLGMPAAPTY